MAQVDTQPPTIVARYPAPGVTVQGLNTVEVIFDEGVAGVDPSDLLINGVPATSTLFGVPGQIVFAFPTPATGQVTFAFAADHGITDLASPPNAFAGDSWSCIYDPNSLPATFLITEFMADNKKTLNDENGDQSDWIEIYNPRAAAGNLQGWFLTDDAANLTKWRFPDRTMEANTYLVVFASGKNRTNAIGNLHTSFQLNSTGEYLALVDPNTNVVSAFTPVYPPQQPDVSYGRDRGNPSILGYFTKPTPGGPNTPGGPGFAPEVQFSRDNGTFPTNQPFALSLSTPLAGAAVYYAFGTNFPSSNGVTSFLYTSPIQITNTAAVRARAFAPGLLSGPVTTKMYVGLSTQTNVLNFNSDLPIVILHDYGAGVLPADKTQKRTIILQTFETTCGQNSMTNPPTLTARASLHTRGSSTITSSSSKAAFSLELRDEFDDDLKVSLLGLPKESDWVLYAPNNFEPALIHNPLAHELFRDMGKYGSRTRFVEVFLKDDPAAPPATLPQQAGAISSADFTSSANAGDYQGVYVLEERIKRDPNRVDIAKLEPQHIKVPEVTGGYIFSIDRSAPGEGQLQAGGSSLNWIEPSYFTMTNAARAPQVAWIKGYFDSFAAGLTRADWTNTASTNFFGNYIDIDSWVTLHIHEVLTFNVDGLRLSGYFFKDRSKKIEYGPTWDYDRTQGSTDGRDFNPRVYRSTVPDLGTDFYNFTPWWARLFSAPDFWQVYIDKYQYYRRPGNALSYENISKRINELANEVRAAQPRDVAKWNIRPRTGVVTAGGFSYNFGPGNLYQNEIDFKLAWYSNRLDFMDTNFLAPPLFSSSSGPVTNGYRITLNPGPKPGSVLIYTLDGTDPRLSGGAISPSAFSNLSSVTITVSSNVHIFARSYNPTHRNLTGPNNPPISSPWSGPTEASLFSSVPPLRITELMYHPPDPPAGSTNSADDFEYIEFTNIGGQPLNLNRFKLRGGVDFDFGNAILNPGQSGVIVRDATAFAARYGSGAFIFGVYTNDNLSNSGENLRLIGSMGEPILDFDYSDNWYPATDGAGFSLVIVNANAPTTSWGLKESWRPSGTLNGTPGSSDSAVTIPQVVINEIMTHTDPPNFDAIELFNPGAGSANIGGWYLTDDFGKPKKYRVPDGTTIAAGAYTVFFATNQANPAMAFGRAFNLSSTGGEVYLFSANPANSNLTGYAQGFDFGPQENGATFGRYLTSTGSDQFPTQTNPTLGSANSGPRIGPVVISEISYHPPDLQLTFRSIDNCIDEYIELQNTSTAAVPLYDPAHATNTWRLRDAVKFSFPPGTSIPAGGIILVVPIDPANVEQATGFRTRNGVSAGVALYGPWAGKLDNSSGSVELARPDSPNATDVPYVLVERVKYSDDLPWPPAADGFGPVLQRVSLSAYGNDPANWTSGIKSPGGPFNPAGGPSITQQPASLTIIEGNTASFSVGAGGPGPFTYEWLLNGNPIAGQTGSTLLLSNVKTAQAGTYSCLVLNSTAALLSSNATLTVRSLPRILSNPVTLSLRGSTNADYGFTTNNANFVVVATGSGDIHYQWRKDGTPLAGATSPILTIPNVGLDEQGAYDVLISDDIGTLTSVQALLKVLVTPQVLQAPLSQIVTTNGFFSASVVIRGNPPPFRYEWREISTIRVTNIVSELTNFITYGPLTTGPFTNKTTQWRLVIFNEATPPQGVLASFNVVSALDTDGDGIPDSADPDPLNAGDRDLDPDGDGMSNYLEYLAGTDPNSSSSNLKLSSQIADGNVTLSFVAQPSHTYSVQYTTSLSSPSWVKLSDVFASSASRQIDIVDPNPGGPRFYRVITPRQ